MSCHKNIRKDQTLNTTHTQPDRAVARGDDQTNHKSTRSVIMKKLIFGLVVIMFIGGGVYFYFARAGAAAQPAVTAAQPAVAASSAVVAEGRVVPARSVALSFENGGAVADVLVHEGDQVQAGQVLARLDQGRLAVTLARSQAQLRQAQ